MTRVLIVGAGIGGITAGLALRRANIDTAIFEKAGSLRDLQVGSHAAGAVSRQLGAPTLGLRRSELHRALVDVIGEDAIEFGAECVGTEQDDNGVTARFADGRTERGDVLIAADGAHSAIRRLLLGDTPTP